MNVPGSKTWYYFHNAEGQHTTTILPNNMVSSFHYDGGNRLTKRRLITGTSRPLACVLLSAGFG